jgi:hypothetical protein
MYYQKFRTFSLFRSKPASGIISLVRGKMNRQPLAHGIRLIVDTLREESSL